MEIDLLDVMIAKPDAVWGLALMGAVCVVGVVEFCKCWTEKNKKAVKWVVLFVSLLVAFILSPLVPPVVTAIVIIWLLVLAVATIAFKTIKDGIPGIIAKAMGKEGGKE